MSTPLSPINLVKAKSQSFNPVLLLFVILYYSPTPPCSCTWSTRTPSGRASAPPSCSPHSRPPCTPSPPAHSTPAIIRLFCFLFAFQILPSSLAHWTPPSSPSRCCTLAAPAPSQRCSSPRYGWGPAQLPTTCTHSPWILGINNLQFYLLTSSAPANHISLCWVSRISIFRKVYETVTTGTVTFVRAQFVLGTIITPRKVLYILVVADLIWIKH